MDFTKLPLFQRLSDRMGWLSARQDVLSQNVANADTPAYTPRDLKTQDFGDHLQKLMPVSPELTNPAHLMGTITAKDKGPDSEKSKNAYESAPAGNSVILEEQMMKVQQTQMNYQLITDLYRKHVDIMKRAIGT
jgi:flagellar basal-body rod protein FlgB